MSSPAYTRLREFLDQKMQMQHIYQPVMLEVLLTHSGRATIRDIATAFLAHDVSQIEYYEQTVKKMPGRVLASHGISAMVTPLPWLLVLMPSRSRSAPS